MLAHGENLLHKTLVDRKKILLLPLHIKLGIIKSFIKALPKNGNSLLIQNYLNLHYHYEVRTKNWGITFKIINNICV